MTRHHEPHGSRSCHSLVVADDDRVARERLAALEAEVKAEAGAARARKDEALARLCEQQAEQAELRARQQAIVAKKRPSATFAMTRMTTPTAMAA